MGRIMTRRRGLPATPAALGFAAVLSWRQQALIEAPVDEVWAYVGDPASYPHWAKNVVSVTGLAEIVPDGEFRQVSRTPLGGSVETIFKIEELDDLHRIKLRCQRSGYYSRWVLTEARAATLLEVEIGIESAAVQYRVAYGARGKRYLRRIAEDTIDGLREALKRAPAKT